MSLASDELKKRRPEAEADRKAALALLAAALLFLTFEARRPGVVFTLARYFSPLLPFGRLIAGARGRTVRAQARDGLQDFFHSEARRFAAELEATRNLRAWRASMFGGLAGYMVAQKAAALGRPLLPSEALDIFEAMNFELRKARNFAEEIRRRNFGGSAGSTARPLSTRAIGARSELYAGSGRAVWFRADEVGRARGVVFYYEAVDDAGTCEPCLDAEAGSPYLPGEGVFPGEVCKGRGRCRCLRIPRDAPREFERLMNRKRQLTRAGLL